MSIQVKNYEISGIGVPVSMANKQLAAFPNAQIHLLQECGHWPYLEQTEQVKLLLMDFYSGLFSKKLPNTLSVT